MLFLMNEFPVYNRGSRRLAPEARPFKATNAVLRSNSFRTSCGLSAFYLPFKCSQYQRRPINNGGGIMPLPCACARPPEPNKVHHRLISAFRSGRQAGRREDAAQLIEAWSSSLKAPARLMAGAIDLAAAADGAAAAATVCSPSSSKSRGEAGSSA